VKGDGDTDGDQLIVEGVRGGKYHVVDRWMPDPAYAELCRYMLDLTGIKVGEAWDGYHGIVVAPEPRPESHRMVLPLAPIRAWTHALPHGSGGALALRSWREHEQTLVPGRGEER
jgi:hypothetical protein